MSEFLFKGLAHIGIFTDDPQKCVDFYCENLGFTPYHAAEFGPVKLRFVRCGSCVIEFVGAGSKPENGIVDHIALEVQNIEAIVKNLKAKGVPMEGEIGSMPGFFPNGFKNIFITGPAGERIELVNYSK